MDVVALNLAKADAARKYVPSTSLGAESIRTSDARAWTPWRAALANRDNAPARLLLLGDSRTEGTGASARSKRWAERMAATLRTRFPVTGGNPAYAPINYVPVKYISTTMASMSMWSAPINNAGGGTSNGLGLGTRTVTLAAGASTTLTFTGTSVKLAYVRTVGATSFSYSVDGGAAVTVDSGGGLLDGRTVAIGPLSAGVHTILVTSVSGLVHLSGAYIYNGEESAGIQVFDAGHHGLRSGNIMGAGATTYTAAIAAVDPHCVVIDVGTNDHGANIDPAAYKTNMQALLSAVNAACVLPPTIVFAPSPGRSSGFTYPWSAYVDVMRELVAADPQHVTLVDLGSRMPPTSDNSLQLYYDTLHENDKGHAFRGDILAAALSPL
jgi:lysophospholipase L1-like esterase